jgi:hypothetical protein
MPQPYSSTTLVLWLEPNVRETGEMQHCPKAIASVREVVAGCRGTRGRIQAAENHVEASAEDIRFISDQTASPSAGPARPMATLRSEGPTTQHELHVFSMILARSRQPSPDFAAGRFPSAFHLNLSIDTQRLTCSFSNPIYGM